MSNDGDENGNDNDDDSGDDSVDIRAFASARMAQASAEKGEGAETASHSARASDAVDADADGFSREPKTSSLAGPPMARSPVLLPAPMPWLL